MTTAALKVCTHCAHMNPPDARFCNQCGKSIAGQNEPERYTPKHLSDKILKMRSALEGERKQVTVLFVDVKGSVALSQRVEAEQWHAIMDRFFAILTENVHNYEGTVNQYTGDGVMALFGAPIAHEDHAERACRSALAMRKGILELAKDLERTHGIAFAARFGLNSGEVIVGRIGDDLRMDYTAQGQTVGLAARMEQSAKPNSILLSVHTRDLVKRHFSLEERSALNVKGFDHRIKTYELTGFRQAGAAAKSAVREDMPLIGRDRELSLLQGYRERVEAQAHGLLVSITADTGLGKSRICREFVSQCRSQNVPVYLVRGSSHHRVEPLAAFRDFFRSYFGLDSAVDDESARELLMPQLAEFEPLSEVHRENLLSVLGLDVQEGSAPVDAQRRIDMAMEFMLLLMRDGALNRHSVCVIENIHWLDEARTAAFLDAVVRQVPHFPLLLVVTARSDYALRWKDLSYLRTLNLAPLTEAQSQEFLDGMLGGAKELAQLKHDIAERAGGSPMFMEEVVRQLLDTGVLERDGRVMKLRREPGRIDLPPSVQAVVAARIDALSDDGKRLLQTAAVIGRRIPLSLLQAVFVEDSFDTALAELLKQGFLSRDVGSQARAAVLFTQALFQTVAYDALLSDQRQDLHARVAAALEPGVAADMELAAHAARHYAAAGEASTAANWYLAAAERAARADLSVALRHLDQARAVLEKVELDAPLRSQYLRLLSRWLQFAARQEVKVERIAASLALAQELVGGSGGVDDASKAFYLVAAGSVDLSRGDLGGALRHFHDAQSLAEHCADPALDLAVRVPLVYALQASGQLGEALQLADESLALCAADPELGAQWLSYTPAVALLVLKAWITLWMGRVAQARTLATQALERAQLRQDSEQIVAALCVAACAATEAGDSAAAVNYARQAQQVAASMENRVAQMLADVAMGRAQLRHGAWVDAITGLEDVLARRGQHAFGMGEVARVQLDLSLAHLAAGNPRLAREAANRAVKLASDCGAHLTRAEAQIAQLRAGLFSSRPLGFLKRYQGTLDEIAAYIEASQARLLEPEYLLLRARWLRLRGEQDEALVLEEQASRQAQECGAALPMMTSF